MPDTKNNTNAATAMPSGKFSIQINGRWEHSDLPEGRAEELAADYRRAGEKHVFVVPAEKEEEHDTARAAFQKTL